MSVVLPAPFSGVSYSPALPLQTAYVEQQIVDYLHGIQQDGAQSSDPITVAVAAVLSRIAVDHFPDKPESYRFTHRAGQVLVSYGGAESPQDPTTIDEVRQEVTRVWHFDVVVRDLGWAYGGQPSGPSPGAYGILDALRLALCGWRVPGYTKMVFLRERFIRRDPEGSGVWYYESDFSHRCVIIENDVEPDYPAFARLQALERGGVTTVEVPADAYTFDVDGEIQLPYANVSEVVVTAPVSGATYEADVDYTLDYVSGKLTVVESGALAAGDTVIIAYSHGEILVVGN